VKECFTLPDLKSPDEEVDLAVKIGSYFDGTIADILPMNFIFFPVRGPFITRF